MYWRFLRQIVFVILPTGMEDPQSAVGFLKKLNPADIAAIFITCGVDDLKAKLEKLEQVLKYNFCFYTCPDFVTQINPWVGVPYPPDTRGS